jgi:lipopolysaccharide/colanic/teichoic acid biosynthesis glycosyltransferase
LYKQGIKPLLDFTLALIGFVALCPVFLFFALALFIANKGQAFFIQTRPGKNGRLFKIIKFKTMNDKKDLDGNLLPDSERLTAIGGFVRKTSIDEIPQLLNVLKGDMSLIGPRPLLPEYLILYNETQQRRHEVRPGITGWAQVNGRNAISWQKKFEYDVWYVEHIGFKVDAMIFLKTIKKVFNKEGISSKESVTCLPFYGNKK